MADFDGSEGAPIDVETASQWTANYRTAKPGGTKGHFFGFKILNELLAQDGCMGIRIYYALDDRGNQQLVLAGAVANKDDILDLVVDYSVPCPSDCGSPNELNS